MFQRNIHILALTSTQEGVTQHLSFMTFTNSQGQTGKGCNSHFNKLSQISFDNIYEEYNIIQGVSDNLCSICVAVNIKNLPNQT